MRILIEEHQYQAEQIRDVLHGIDAMQDIDGNVSINYVGYYYNTQLSDCVFILPKVLLEDTPEGERVFGKYAPETIVNLNQNNPLSQQEKDFIYEFSVWIYRTIEVYNNTTRNGIVYHQKIACLGKSNRQINNTFLDILLALIDFNKHNQDFIFFILKNIHSGYNRIHWSKTIATTRAIISKNSPVYTHPVNRKKQINFDEELLIIFYSILNYISERYGFANHINCNFQLITGYRFKAYLDGLGKTRLLQIKYKYFSDKALHLWQLCYDFFDNAKRMNIQQERKEYLLVKSFNIVFEAIIDELLGEKNIPAGLKEQADGKRIDHLYSYQNLITTRNQEPVYYIGDSKYYKLGHSIGKESVYKQFTYARNIIQWNLNLFMNDDKDDEELQYDKRNFGNVPKLRDDLTEGYNIIPNFFISAKMAENLSFSDQISSTDREKKCFNTQHFNDRLFDRDTLLVFHYDVNFLYVVSLYARHNEHQKFAWKNRVRKMFRDEIQKMLDERYDFYRLTPKEETQVEKFVSRNFRKLIGKIFSPTKSNDYLILAFEKEDSNEEQKEAIINDVKEKFYIEGFALSANSKID